MERRYLKYTFVSLLWTVVLGYLLWASLHARSLRSELRVTELKIEVADSSARGHLVSSKRVAEWIRRSGKLREGTPVGKLDLEGVERLILKNGFVESVAAYVRRSGEVRVKIHQREPLLRLLTGGMNAYVTAEGYVFQAPQAASLYVPVLTGDYEPPCPRDFNGSMEELMEKRLEEFDAQILRVGMERRPLFERRRRNRRKLDSIRRLKLPLTVRFFASSERKDKAIDELLERKKKLRRQCRYESRLIDEGMARVETKQTSLEKQQKKLEKSYEDFTKLLTFVENVENDDFWSAEVVQIVVTVADSGALEVELVPRSGRHTILFGRLENIEQKFDNLLCFYRKGLGRIGWDKYKVIDVRYRGQVVCRK